MKEFEKLYAILSKLREECPSDKARSKEKVINNLKEEIKEVEKAITLNDKENLTEELGDFLWNILFLIRIYEEQGDLTINKVLNKMSNKFTFRHPHVFENPRKISIEEADKIWKEQKIKEKELGIKH